MFRILFLWEYIKQGNNKRCVKMKIKRIKLNPVTKQALSKNAAVKRVNFNKKYMFQVHNLNSLFGFSDFAQDYHYFSDKKEAQNRLIQLQLGLI